MQLSSSWSRALLYQETLRGPTVRRKKGLEKVYPWRERDGEGFRVSLSRLWGAKVTDQFSQAALGPSSSHRGYG